MSFILSLIAAGFYSVSSALLTRTLKRHSVPANDPRPTPMAMEIPVNDAAIAMERQQQQAVLEQNTQIRRLTLIFASVGVVIHGWIVIHQTGLPHDLSLPLLTSVSATTLTIVLLQIALCLRQPADYLGLAVYPTAAVALLVTQASTGGTPIHGHAIQIHILISLVSYSVLALAAGQAVLVSIQRHFLRTHKPGGFLRVLPPLDTTERLLFSLLTAGFVLLSLALLSGFIFLESMFDQRLVHKTVLSCVGWAIFGILLFGRWRFGWRGKKAVYWTLAGYVVLVVAYFGTKTVIEQWLSAI